jgi:hypothetical protein
MGEGRRDERPRREEVISGNVIRRRWRWLYGGDENACMYGLMGSRGCMPGDLVTLDEIPDGGEVGKGV